ncbi:MAG TPA: hypothetical protein VHZ24_15905 [Pirellulales bacterium]|jgi:hypothetical protein|nr:hypothetical protein [Pirellulales bacterium]
MQAFRGTSAADRIIASETMRPSNRPAGAESTSPAKANSLVDAHVERPLSVHQARHAEVAQRVQQLLQTSPYLALRTVTCEFDGESLFLRGRVPTFHTKQVAFMLVNRLGLSIELVDQLEVISAAPKGSRRRPR